MQSPSPTVPAALSAGPARDVAGASEPWSALDRLTGLAARALQASAAVLVLVEDVGNPPRVRYAHGLDPAVAAGGALFYQQALRESAMLLVTDARQDARVAKSPLVREAPYFRACAAVTLNCPQDGPRPGVLCVFDNRPRQFTGADTETLAHLGELVLHELERHHAALCRETELETRVRERTAELADAESRYRGIFENAVEGIYQSLPGGGLLSVNPALARLLGYASPETMLAEVHDPARLYVHPERRAEFEAEILAGGELAGWESEAYRADGSRLWIAESARAIRDADGAVVRYEGTFEDITARKTAEEELRRAREELEDRVRDRTAELALLNGTLRQHILEREIAEASSRRSESKFRALIENTQDLISILTPDGISLYQSPSVEYLTGFPPEELIGRNIFEEFIHPDDRAAVARASAAIVENGEHYVRIEVRCRHRDGSWRLLESIGSSTPPDSPVIGLVVNSRDITERRRAELEHEARTREQTAVAELGRYALDERGLPDILDKAVELVARALQVPFCTVTELLPGGAKLRVRAGVGWREGVVRGAEVDNWRRKQPGADEPATVEKPLIVADLETLLGRPYLLPTAEGLGHPRSAISVVVHCDGQRFGTLCALSPELDRFGPQDAVFLQTAADLLSAVIESERHKAASREVQARYERIAANTPGMVYQSIRHADGTATIPFVSEGCRQLYGLEPVQIYARPELLNERIHEEDRARAFGLLAASNEALTPLQWEGRLVHPSGEVRWVAARSRPERLPSGDIYRDGVVFDVTELKRAQEEAEKANRAKSEFLSRISHELRTPLNAILGFGQLLDLERLTSVQRSSVEQILKGGRHLLDLINEVLDITRIESGGMDLSLEPVDAAAVLTQALVFVRPLAEQHRVRFVPFDAVSNPAVLADRGRLHQVLLNLLSNAVKYNREDGEVRVACAPLDAGTVRLSITDTGPGLTPDELGLLFTPFQRLGAARRGVAGTGIGLTISRSLVEAMGGTVGVTSTPGTGSTFYVDLPAAPADAVGPTLARENPLPALPPTLQAPAERTILLIDNQNSNVSLIERVLETRANLRLFTAADGRGGLALARKQVPDLILLDLHLPDMGGDEVMRRLRLEARTRDVPVVVLSADATPSQINRLRQLGVSDYLTKPFRIRELLAAIDAELDQKSEVRSKK